MSDRAERMASKMGKQLSIGSTGAMRDIIFDAIVAFPLADTPAEAVASVLKEWHRSHKHTASRLDDHERRISALEQKAL